MGIYVMDYIASNRPSCGSRRAMSCGISICCPASGGQGGLVVVAAAVTVVGRPCVAWEIYGIMMHHSVHYQR